MNNDRIKRYSLIKLESTTDISNDIRSNRIVSKVEYFKIIQDFIEMAPILLEKLEKTLSKSDLKSSIETAGALQNFALKINSPSLIWDSSKLVSAISLGMELTAFDNFKQLKKNITSLSANIKKAEIRDESENDNEINKDIEQEDDEIKWLKESPEANKKKNILAIDDMPDVLRVLKIGLKKYYNVIGITNHLDTIKYLISHKADLILLDIEMPDIDGFTLMGIIRKLSGYENVPVIFLTGNASVEYVKKAIENGASDFIIKPVDLDIVLQKIRKHLNRI